MKLFKWLFQSKPKEYPTHDEYAMVGRWPFSRIELKEWQDQYDRPYNPLAIDISICVPNGYVDRDGNIWRMKLVDLNKINQTNKELTDNADRHGDGRPNGI